MSAPSTPIRELVLASAGSGKTFRISSRIIGLLAGGAEPRDLLASTFTRKAAGEILERVLVRLAQAATDEAGAEMLSRDAGRPGSDGVFWAELLKRVVTEMHQLNIGTLDSFFVRVVQVFSHDLGLPPKWGIADDATRETVRSQALERVLSQMGTDDFVDLVRALANEHVQRSVHDRLARDVDALLDVHHALDPAGPGWSAMRPLATPRPTGFDAMVEGVAALVERATVPRTAKNQPNKNWENAQVVLARALRGRDWFTIAGQGLGKSLLDAPTPADATYYRTQFPDDLLRATEQAVEIAKGELTRLFAARAEAMGALAEMYDAAYREGMASTGRLGFDDVTRALAAGTALGAREALDFRLDGAVRHVLLDEFQDTSMPQWRALLPLVDTVAADRDGALVVVADPKQSIYGWRGAAPDVVGALGDRYDLSREPLFRSWRSSPDVLAAVNRIFDGLAENAAVKAHDDGGAAPAWQADFRAHEAEHGEQPGFARVLVGPALRGTTDLQPELIRFAAREIEHLHREAPGRSLGVLVRTNDQVASFIHELGEIGVDASEEGGTRLVGSAGVVSVLAFLRSIDHPGDTLAGYHVATTAVGAAVGIDQATRKVAARAVLRSWRRRLVEDGYGRTLAALVRDLGEVTAGRDSERLRRLVELGYAWDAESSGAGLRVDDFVRRAESERAESPGEHAVRVMTVHGSKGLEFDTVVLPQLHAPMIRGGGDSGPMGYRPDGVGLITHAFPPIGKDILTLFADVPELVAARRQRDAARLRDALGVLYVAATRARYALHFIIPADPEKGRSKAFSAARIVTETLCGDPAERLVEGSEPFALGDRNWYARLPEPVRAVAVGSVDSPSVIALRRRAARSRGLERSRPSEPGVADVVDLASKLGIGRSGGALQWGSLVHAWLETLEWHEGGLGEDPSLRAVARQVAPDWDEADIEGALVWVREALTAPAVRTALLRSTWPAGTVVERELPFLWRDGDVLVEGIMDRLLLVLGSNGEPAEAVIQDYKTDRFGEDPERDADRMDHYREQMGTYVRAVQSLYGLSPGHVRAELILLGRGDVVTV